MARTVGRVVDLIEEDGEVEREPKADGVGGWHFSLADVKRGLVGVLRVLHNLCCRR